MSLPYIQGNDVLLYLAEAASSSNIKLWGCCRNVVLNGETETIEVTPISGKNTSFLPTYNGATIDADGIYIIPEYTDTRWSSNQLWEWRINHTLLYWKLVFAKADGSEDIYEGTCYLTRTNASGAVNDVAGMTISAVVVSGGQSTQEVSYACPVVSLSSTLFTVSYSFFDLDEGVTTYYVALLDSLDNVLEVDVVNDPFAAPITGTFSGLDPDTTYKVQISLEVDSPYYQRQCSAVTIATDELLAFPAFGGSTKQIACDETNPITVYAESIAVGNFFYTDATGQTPYTTYEYINIDGVVYRISTTTGEILSNEGACLGTVYSYRVKAGTDPCSAGFVRVYSTTATFGAGMTLYSNITLTTVYVNNSLVAAYEDPFPPTGAVAGTVVSDGDQYNFIGGIVGSITGDRC